MNGLMRKLILLSLISPSIGFASDAKIYQTPQGCMACHQGAPVQEQQQPHHHHKNHSGKNAPQN